MAGKYRRTAFPLRDGTKIDLYVGQKIHDALKEIANEMSLYEGVRLSQIVEAVYKQGLKDGARKAFEKIEDGVVEAKKAVPHRNPGRPNKSARRKAGSAS